MALWVLVSGLSRIRRVAGWGSHGLAAALNASTLCIVLGLQTRYLMSPLLLLVAPLIIRSEAATIRDTVFRNNDLNNRLFLEDIAFVSPAITFLDCARKCHVHGSCLTFTFDGTSCQGHSKVMNSDSAHKVVVGVRSFVDLEADLLRCRRDGVQQLVVPSLELNMQVSCDGDWMVILRRQDGSVGFYRDWQQYEAGFGNVDGELWIGLKALYKITNTQAFDIRIDLGDWDGNFTTVHCTNFSITSPQDNYRLHMDFVQAAVNDSMSPLSGQGFSTYDKDNDGSKKNCAVKLHGAWWYRDCSGCNLMGDYRNSSYCPLKDCVTWKGWHGINYSLKFAQMKIRPV